MIHLIERDVWRNYLYFKCFPHYTEYQWVCCHILGGINIRHAHWGGTEPVSGPRMEETLHDVHFGGVGGGLIKPDLVKMTDFASNVLSD